MPPSGQVFMWTPLSVEYSTIVSSADAEFVEVVEHLSDALVVLDHGVVVLRLAIGRLDRGSRSAMWVRKCIPVVLNHMKKGVSLSTASLMKRLAGGMISVVDALHALLCQRTGVLDATVGEAVDDPARTEVLAEVREVLGVRVGRRSPGSSSALRWYRLPKNSSKPWLVGRNSSRSPKWFLPNWAVV